MKTTEKKLAELNALDRIVREWQRGAISQAQMKGRLGEILTAEQIDAILPRLTRYSTRAQVATAIAETVGI